MKNKVVLITGCAGMIGSNLCHWLIENTDFTIVGVDDLSGGYMENTPVNKRFIFFQYNAGDTSSVRFVFNVYSPSIVYHASAYAAENLSPFIRKFNYTNNLVVTANIVNMCIEFSVDRLVFFSSIAVYGHGKPPYKETDSISPNDPYANAKAACEIDIKIAGEQHGLDWCIVRPYNVYGRRQNIKDKYRNVLGIFINQYLSMKPFTIFGDGKQVRGFTNVLDILQPLSLAGTSPKASKQVINLGSERQYTIKDAATMLIEVLGGGSFEYLPARHEVHQAYADNTLAKQILNFKDETSLTDGLIDMAKWVKENPILEETISPKYEIQKGMYEAWKK